MAVRRSKKTKHSRRKYARRKPQPLSKRTGRRRRYSRKIRKTKKRMRGGMEGQVAAQAAELEKVRSKHVRRREAGIAAPAARRVPASRGSAEALQKLKVLAEKDTQIKADDLQGLWSYIETNRKYLNDMSYHLKKEEKDTYNAVMDAITRTQQSPSEPETATRIDTIIRDLSNPRAGYDKSTLSLRREKVYVALLRVLAALQYYIKIKGKSVDLSPSVTYVDVTQRTGAKKEAKKEELRRELAKKSPVKTGNTVMAMAKAQKAKVAAKREEAAARAAEERRQAEETAKEQEQAVETAKEQAPEEDPEDQASA